MANGADDPRWLKLEMAKPGRGKAIIWSEPTEPGKTLTMDDFDKLRAQLRLRPQIEVVQEDRSQALKEE